MSSRLLIHHRTRFNNDPAVAAAAAVTKRSSLRGSFSSSPRLLCRRLASFQTQTAAVAATEHETTTTRHYHFSSLQKRRQLTERRNYFSTVGGSLTLARPTGERYHQERTESLRHSDFAGWSIQYRFLATDSSTSTSSSDKPIAKEEETDTNNNSEKKRHDLDEKESAKNIMMDSEKRKEQEGKLVQMVDSEDTEWVPPGRPLAGDIGQSHLIDLEGNDRDEGDKEDADRFQKEYEARKKQDLEAMGITGKASDQLSTKDIDISEVDDDGKSSNVRKMPSIFPVDWMKTRRSSMFGQLSDSEEKSGGEQRRGEIIPVIKHQLLSSQEIVKVLEAYGGQDIVTCLDDPKNRRMSGGIDGHIIATAPSYRHLGQLATQLVNQLRNRKLEETGVESAKNGPEGDPRDPDEIWIVVNCGNYAVHIQLERARKYYKLEYLWSFKDPIWYINSDDEAAIDDYMGNINPISPQYAKPLTEYDKTLQKLETNRFTAPHRPVVKRKLRRKRSKR